MRRIVTKDKRWGEDGAVFPSFTAARIAAVKMGLNYGDATTLVDSTSWVIDYGPIHGRREQIEVMSSSASSGTAAPRRVQYVDDDPDTVTLYRMEP